MGIVAALCHLCQAPTTVTCRVCGSPTCARHMEAGGMCHACMRRARVPGAREGERRPR